MKSPGNGVLLSGRGMGQGLELGGFPHWKRDGDKTGKKEGGGSS